MLLIFVTSLVLALIGFLIYKDRKYLKKQTRDVVSAEMKKILNIPVDDVRFDQDFKKNIEKTRASRMILDSINENQKSVRQDK